MSFMLSRVVVVGWALAAVPSFMIRSSASPAPYTMYTEPVAPVTMLSVFPVKFGVPLACAVAAGEPARGALQATATSTTATNEATIRAAFLISHLPRNGRSLRRLRRARAVQPERAPGFGRGCAAAPLVRFGGHRREGDRSPTLVGGDEDQVRGCDEIG